MKTAHVYVSQPRQSGRTQMLVNQIVSTADQEGVTLHIVEPITEAKIEAAAEALWNEDRKGTYQPQYPYSGLAEEARIRLRLRARAALEAARDAF